MLDYEVDVLVMIESGIVWVTERLKYKQRAHFKFWLWFRDKRWIFKTIIPQTLGVLQTAAKKSR